MNAIQTFKQYVRDLHGIVVENDQTQPGIEQIESAVAISRFFQGDAMRQQLDHEADAAGGFRRFHLDNNARHLGRV
jgi:hypothetical protein